MEDIAALIAAGECDKAQAAIAEARRELRLSGAEARALGKQLDKARAAAPPPQTGRVGAGRRA